MQIRQKKKNHKHPTSLKKYLIFTPDIHEGLCIDLVSSILSLNQTLFPYAMLSYYLNDRMVLCIPMFVPSPWSLASLGCVHDYYNSENHYCKSGFIPPVRSPLAQHPYSPEDDSYEARVYWFQFVTFYTNATIQCNSWYDIGAMLRSTDYKSIFREHKQENKRIIERNTKDWNKVLKKVR